VLLRSGKYDESIADYDAALKIEPNKVASLYGRGMAKRRKGDYAAGNADIAAAKAGKPTIIAEFKEYGLLPPETEMTQTPPHPADTEPVAEAIKPEDRAPASAPPPAKKAESRARHAR
jgi:tetratricopeptide (TPR) repeat protein